MIYDSRPHKKKRMLLDYLLIVGTISIIFLEKSAIWLMCFLWLIYIILIDYDAKPIPKIVWRYNKKADRFIKYEIDKKTGKYIKKVE